MPANGERILFASSLPTRDAVIANQSIGVSNMPAPRYIAVEGPIGVGKTSLARLLAEEFEARLVLEQVEENPFLRKFYDDPRTYAFQAQLFFLLSRFRQQSALAQGELFQQTTVADYLFAKDQIFAQVNLQPDEWSLYRQVYALLDPRLPKPDLVIYLQARPEILMERLRKRDRDYERHIPRDYIEKIAEAYRYFFFHYRETPLLVADVSEVDFVANGADFLDLVREIRSMAGGVQHYIPLGSKHPR